MNAVMKRVQVVGVLIGMLLLLTACESPEKKKVMIGINPWPGYEFLYLAEAKGFFEEVGAPIEMVQFSSLADVQRAYVNGRVDGMCSTIVEAVVVQETSERPLDLVMFPDYSDGGDMILADKTISTMADLKGKRVGLEVSSLGVFVLLHALERHGLSLQEVELLNVEQVNGYDALRRQEIDAFVTYPPESVAIIEDDQYHKIFSTKEIPKAVLDAVTLSKEVIAQDPAIVGKLHQAWEMALDYYERHPKESIAIMAQREGISETDFADILGDVKIMTIAEQMAIMSNSAPLVKQLNTVCDTLQKHAVFDSNCEKQAALWSFDHLSL